MSESQRSSYYSRYYPSDASTLGYVTDEGSAGPGSSHYYPNQRFTAGHQPRSQPPLSNNPNSAPVVVDRGDVAPFRHAGMGCMETYNFRYKGLIPTGLALLTFMLATLSLLAGMTPADNLNDCNLLLVRLPTWWHAQYHNSVIIPTDEFLILAECIESSWLQRVLLDTCNGNLHRNLRNECGGPDGSAIPGRVPV